MDGLILVYFLDTGDILRIGLIDNLRHIDQFRSEWFHEASARRIDWATGGNTGNVAFVFGARLCMAGTIARIGWDWDPQLVRSQVDCIVVSCANQLGSHVDLGGWGEALKSFDLPVILWGLGAQSEFDSDDVAIPNGTRSFLDVVQQLRVDPDISNIGVRGGFTKKVLRDIGYESEVVGCPSLLISSRKNIGESIGSRQEDLDFSKIAVTGGNPWHQRTAFLEEMLLRLVDQRNGVYVLQHPLSLLQLANGELDELTGSASERVAQVYAYAGASLFDISKWFKRNSAVFSDAPNWMRFLGHYDAVIGPRYHGVALGIQAGIGGCVINIDKRTKELCVESAIKSVDADEVKGLSVQELVDLCRWSPDDALQFDLNRVSKAHITRDFLSLNNVPISDHLKSLC